MVRDGEVDGLMFQFRTKDGGHFHGVAGHYRVNLTEAVGSLTRLKIKMCQLMADRAKPT